MYWNGSKYTEGGIKNPKEFKERIKHIAIRRERQEVMKELPLVNRTQVLCEMQEHTQKIYNEEADKIKAIIHGALIDGTEDSFTTQSCCYAIAYGNAPDYRHS